MKSNEKYGPYDHTNKNDVFEACGISKEQLDEFYAVFEQARENLQEEVGDSANTSQQVEAIGLILEDKPEMMRVLLLWGMLKAHEATLNNPTEILSNLLSQQ